MDEYLGDWVDIYLGELYFVQLDYRNIECSLGLKKIKSSKQYSVVVVMEAQLTCTGSQREES